MNDANQSPPFDLGADARRVLRLVRSGALATVGEPAAHPFVSLTNVATDIDGSPILLLSSLAAHTRQLDADPRCSLLLAETGKGDPLTHPRVTVIARAERAGGSTDEPRLRSRFLRRHPKAGLYAGFGDFGFWRLRMERGHHNAGFGRAGSLAPGILDAPEASPDFVEAEEGAVQHINTDHADFVERVARARTGVKAHWRVSGIDPEGVDVMAGIRVARLAFAEPVTKAAQLRHAVVALGAGLPREE